MIYLIAGRTGSGKDYLASKLTEKGMRIVKSYTTRPRRNENEDTHIFITKEEAAGFTDKVAITNINGYEYFATAAQVKKSDVYIIDPNGIDVLVKNMPETEFQIVYVEPDDDINRRAHAVKRADKPIEEEQVFNQRDAAENQQFSKFEKKIHKQMDKEACFPENISAVIIYTNIYDDAHITVFAQSLVDNKVKIEHMKNIVRECRDMGILSKAEETDENGESMVYAYHEVEKGKEPRIKVNTVERCAIRLFGGKDNFLEIMEQYIERSKRFETALEIKTPEQEEKPEPADLNPSELTEAIKTIAKKTKPSESETEVKDETEIDPDEILEEIDEDQ